MAAAAPILRPFTAMPVGLSRLRSLHRIAAAIAVGETAMRAKSASRSKARCLARCCAASTRTPARSEAFAACGVGHGSQQRRAGLPAAGRPADRDRRRPRPGGPGQRRTMARVCPADGGTTARASMPEDAVAGIGRSATCWPHFPQEPGAVDETNCRTNRFSVAAMAACGTIRRASAYTRSTPMTLLDQGPGTCRRCWARPVPGALVRRDVPARLHRARVARSAAASAPAPAGRRRNRLRRPDVLLHAGRGAGGRIGYILFYDLVDLPPTRCRCCRSGKAA